MTIQVPDDFLQNIETCQTPHEELSSVAEEAVAYQAIGDALSKLSGPSQKRVLDLVNARKISEAINATLLKNLTGLGQLYKIIKENAP